MKKSEVIEICDKALYNNGIISPKDFIRIREEYFKLSQTDLSTLLGYADSSSVSHFERGARPTNPRAIYRIMEAMKP